MIKDSDIQTGSQQYPMSLPAILCMGAEMSLKNAVEAEIQNYLQSHADVRTEDGKSGIVRNGCHRSRKKLSGCGSLEVSVPRSRSRAEGIPPFVSALIPKYMRKTLELEDALPLFIWAGCRTEISFHVLRNF